MLMVVAFGGLCAYFLLLWSVGCVVRFLESVAHGEDELIAVEGNSL